MVKRVTLNDKDQGCISLFDTDEKLMLSIMLKPGLNEINLYEIPLECGTYSYKVFVNEHLVEAKNLIIIS
jgi:hypothetical protein